MPVAGILGSALILGEAMHPIEAVGGAVIVLGLAFNVFGPRLLRIAESDGLEPPEPRRLSE